MAATVRQTEVEVEEMIADAKASSRIQNEEALAKSIQPDTTIEEKSTNGAPPSYEEELQKYSRLNRAQRDIELESLSAKLGLMSSKLAVTSTALEHLSMSIRAVMEVNEL